MFKRKMSETYYIQTEKSYLKSIHINMDELLHNCALDVDGMLLENPPIVVYGKQCHQHRSIGFFSNNSIGYKYSNQIANSIPLTPHLSELLNLVNEMLRTDFNGILVNKYANGEDYISKHSDNEVELDQIGVVCVSYGATRKFRIRSKTTGKIVIDVPTQSSEMLIMGGNFQNEFTHEIPVEKKVKCARLSFTFRKHNK
jgi:alpha-ketoglutarate-dependent dioxygenase alkB family protein 2